MKLCDAQRDYQERMELVSDVEKRLDNLQGRSEELWETASDVSLEEAQQELDAATKAWAAGTKTQRDVSAARLRLRDLEDQQTDARNALKVVTEEIEKTKQELSSARNYLEQAKDRLMLAIAETEAEKLRGGGAVHLVRGLVAYRRSIPAIAGGGNVTFGDFINKFLPEISLHKDNLADVLVELEAEYLPS